MLIGPIDDLHQDFKFLMKLKFSFIKPPSLEQQAGVLACWTGVEILLGVNLVFANS